MRHFYHSDIFLPHHLLTECSGRFLRLSWTYSAKRFADHFNMEQVSTVTLLRNNLVEVVLDDADKIVSVTPRLNFSSSQDLFLSLEPFFNDCTAKVKHAWLNPKRDNSIRGRTARDYEPAEGQVLNIVRPRSVLQNPVWQGLEAAV